ncbi:MAG: cyclopropane-fatty-acyl-phospholipid synthase family protein [Thermoleophilia bacterium]|nr:cyclopropane-fatty-acyl-phospholipid synthase family protein [Thermoleophilia bacterium]MDH3724188.1 cyclopropane-fatty-acyl-phospholipid synthase family protein [Thermoleophilia bacterium]
MGRSLRALGAAPIVAAERGWVPDGLIRAGIRARVARRSAREAARSDADIAAGRAKLAAGPVAIGTDDANAQHYEVPPGFFAATLGPRLKYSCCQWDTGATTLGAAEEHSLRLVCERADIKDGMRVLDLGCGWGSLSLWIAEHFPRSEVTAISNSTPQGEWIRSRCSEGGLTNVTHEVAEIGSYTTVERFDRVTSVEMLEHVRNWPELLFRVGTWLAPGGRLFVHVFCHRRSTYVFDAEQPGEWMARSFFTGGMMPGFGHVEHSLTNLTLERRWRVSGTHYQRTADAWLDELDANRDAALGALGDKASANAGPWLNRWRIFHMAVSELFGFADGREWFVAHYRLAPEGGPA